MRRRWITRDPGAGFDDPLCNGRLLDNERWAGCSDNANTDPERKRPSWSGRVTVRKPADERAFALRGDTADDVERSRLSIGFIACAHLAEHQRSRSAQNASELKLCPHPGEPVWSILELF